LRVAARDRPEWARAFRLSTFAIVGVFLVLVALLSTTALSGYLGGPGD
jgi:hypothetical protein